MSLRILICGRALLAATLAVCWSLAHAHDIEHDQHVVATAAPAHDAATSSRASVRQSIRRFRQTGDDRHLDAATRLLAPLLASDPDAETLVDAAFVAQALHDFERADRQLDAALQAAPGDRQALLLRAAIALVRGDTVGAADACRALRGVAAVISVTCFARVAIASGNDEAALRRLSAMLKIIDPTRLDTGVLAWVHGVTGDAAARSQPALAATHYARALELEDSTQVRAALIDVLLAVDDVAAAAAQLQGRFDAPALGVRQLIVAVRSGATAAAAARIRTTDHRFRHWIADEDWAHAREMARFYLDVLPQPELAYRLARINAALQREREDLLLLERATAGR